MTARVLRLSCAAAALLSAMAVGATAQAQTPAAPMPPLELKTTKISNSFYVLEGSNCPGVSSCASTGVLAGPDGVLLVDGGSVSGMADKIVAAVRQLTDRPIRFMINSHFHGDHTVNNEYFGKLGVLIVARDELRYRMEYRAPAANGTPTPASPAAALPALTYRGRMTFHMNGEEVQAIAIPAAHTDGDTMVRFVMADAIMTGDFYRNIGYPDMRLTDGGSFKGMTEGLAVLIGMSGPNTKVIAGHGPITNRAGVVAFRDMLLVLRDRVANLIQQGKTADEVVAARPQADYDARLVLSQRGSGLSETALRQLYAEIKAGRAEVQAGR